MTYILLTSKDCKRCDVARKLLEENGHTYSEVDAMTSDGIDLVLRYNTNSMPAIIDEENRIAFSISDFNRYLEMVNKEY